MVSEGARPWGRGRSGDCEKVSRDMGHRSDSIAIARDMGPLSSRVSNVCLRFGALFRESDICACGLSALVRVFFAYDCVCKHLLHYNTLLSTYIYSEKSSCP